MRQVTLFEHQSVPYETFGEDRLEQILSDLEKLNAASGSELFRLGRTRLQATQIVGVVQLPDLIIEVLPKIDYELSGVPGSGTPVRDREFESAARNLLHLLSYTHNIRFHHEDLAHLKTQRSSWLELLTAIFARDLHRQVQRGLIRGYVRIEETLPLIRGRWLVAQQLSRRPHVRHEFDLQYDEFSPDNPLNRVFKYVVEALLRLTRSPSNRTLLLDLQAWLSEVATPAGPPLAELDAVVFTRLNEHFRPSFNLARMFIEHAVIRLSAGKRQTFAFMFDMNILFERFVAGFLQRHRPTVFTGLDPPNIREQNQGRSRYLARRMPDGVEQFRLRPDLLLEDRRRLPLLIVDTKYKQLDPGTRNMGISEADAYQMLAYSAAFECPSALLLYPQSGHSAEFAEVHTTNTGIRMFASVAGSGDLDPRECQRFIESHYRESGIGHRQDLRGKNLDPAARSAAWLMGHSGGHVRPLFPAVEFDNDREETA